MASSNWKHSVFLEKGSLLTPQVGSNFPISRQVFFPIVGNLSFSCFSLSVCNVNEKLFIQKDQKETFTLPGCFLTDFFSNTSESLQVFLVNQMTQKFCLLFSLPVASQPHHLPLFPEQQGLLASPQDGLSSPKKVWECGTEAVAALQWSVEKPEQPLSANFTLHQQQVKK